ncbi:MAG TPA: hypothetical protein PK636_07755, partial [bacterium]|nr:hypothetical protein [bacterium]
GGSGPWLRNGTGIYYDSGGVGIGTGNPQYKLHLHQNSSSYSYATFTNQSTGSGHLDGVLVGLDATEDFRIHSYESNNVKVYIDDDEKMRIQDNGRVGIGTSSPGAMLHVVGSNNDVGLVLRAGHNGSEPFNDIATFYNADGTLAFWFAAQGAAGANDSWTTFSPYISMHFIPEGCRTEDYNVGDVVAVVDKLAVKTGGAFDVAVIGVICPEEGFISIPKELKRAITQEGKKVDDFGLVPVAYQGDVQVKVNNEGGAIRSGDLLVPSSIPGVAMKGMPENFSQYASVIGKAREDFTGESGLISVSVGVK